MTGDTMSGWKITIIRTLHLIGRHPSAESARAFAGELLAAGELDPGRMPWETAIAAGPLGEPDRHPCVTFTNAITSCPAEYQKRCYPDTAAAFEAAATENPYNNTRISLGWCTEDHDAAPWPAIPWGRDTSIEQGIPTQVGYTAHLGDHLFTLLGDTSKTPAGEWVAQVDGRLISDGRTDRESATQAAEQRWMELSGDA